MCLFGLYHGLVFLPALLAFIGPQTHASVAPYPGTPRTPRTPSTASRILSHPRDKKDCDNDGDRDEKFRVEETVEAVSWEDDVRGVSTVEGQDDGPAQAS